MNIETKIIAIKEFKELLDRELISVEEYEVHKKRILSYGILNKAIDELPSYLPKLAWPIFGVILVILFYSPIIDKLSQSSEINMGGFSLKVREGAALIGDPSLALKLEGLSPVAVELLIDSGRKHMFLFKLVNKDKQSAIYYFDSSFFGYLELERAGLLESINLLKKINSWILKKEIKISITPDNIKKI